MGKSRLYWLLGTVALTLALCVWAVAFPPREYSTLPPDRLLPVTGQSFINETVLIDGKDFENCTFSNVTLEFEGKHNFTLRDNHFTGPVKVSWTKDSGKQAALALMMLLNEASVLKRNSTAIVGDDVLFVGQQPESPSTSASPVSHLP